MAQNSKKLSVVGLDYDQIRNNLKAFLKAQDEFSDYDFEGSGLSVLIDLLAYNTHYQGFYANMLANESFLDSAIVRDSVVSKAKALGYTPRSKTSALARVNVSINAATASSNTLVMPRFTKFVSSSVDGVNYIFLTTDTVAVQNSNNQFAFSDVELKEGSPVSYVFDYDVKTNPRQEFELPDADIDTSTLKVVVQNSSQDTTQQAYELAEDATEVTANSFVFYIDESTNGRYKIYFGDGVLGNQLTNGNLVICSYIITKGEAANKATSFKLVEPLSGLSNANVTIIQAAAAGSDRETIDSIKFNAPKAYVSQGRCVTKNDYIALINRKYPYFDAVTVWGGEEHDEPVYGKVFISAKPREGFEITEAEKSYLVNTILKPISVLTVTPVVVDADYNYLNFRVEVTYDPSKTTKTPGQIEDLVRETIEQYVRENLNTFNTTFKLSRLTRAVDDADVSILNNSIEVVLEKRFKPTLNTTKNYTLKFGVPLIQGNLNDKLWSGPAFEAYDYAKNDDEEDIVRSAYFEEVPNSFTGIDEIEVVTPGSGYVSPTVTITGDGMGATATATVVNGKIQSIKVVKRGSEYSTATITIEDEYGSGATATAVLEGRQGVLRTFYFDDNNNKVVLNSDAGDINYESGIITIRNFTPLDINAEDSTLRIHIAPANKVFSSIRNNIITLDESDGAALSITVIPME